MIALHKIEVVRFENDNIVLDIDGEQLILPLEKLSSKLKSASDIERTIYKISASGYGIHWPLIDEDLSIEGILRDFKK